ncbi:uncharacterized protein PHACADRAFT_262250 [Phanerochaete carnosa HHB-10118-sp]|uniref:Uncharacterized protein n=1 Tax=Phanerochaete carnosa (strain HHB-10118-sp) TaxID=650164 RepID=K5VZ43_PHACS|nr:uncharacterized protein PHACADRAFT_262250 [Phanerochaete carnosa HHB-10118-sp]EKM51864.1 hypothetical protein PHACADRAFT_262250 [Phanerochaete carnosa HHB-10118-sp]
MFSAQQCSGCSPSSMLILLLTRTTSPKPPDLQCMMYSVPHFTPRPGAAHDGLDYA